MRRTSRHDTLLHNYELQPRQSVRVEARSETHDFAHMRLRKQDVAALQKHEVHRPIVALFSTDNVRIPVSLRTDERVYVRLPEDCTHEENSQERSEDADSEGLAGALEKNDDRSQGTAGKHARDKRNGNSARKHVAWTPLRVLAHHSYVAGMRVSGIVHRAIVRLQHERA